MNRTHHPGKKNSHLYNQLIFKKEINVIQREKENIFNKSGWRNLINVIKKLTVTPSLYGTQNLVWDLNVKVKTIKVFKRKHFKIPLWTWSQQRFLREAHKKLNLKKNDKLDFKIKKILFFHNHFYENRNAGYREVENVSNIHIWQRIRVQNI